jgi:hypothetical protein
MEMGLRVLATRNVRSKPTPVSLFLLPVKQAGFFRWCLQERFRAFMPMTLMAMGK